MADAIRRLHALTRMRLRSRQIRQESTSSSEDIFEMATNDDVLNNLRAEIARLQVNTNVNANVSAKQNAQRMHVPKFSKTSPQLWFAQVERSFRLFEIADDTDRFDLVTSRLEEDIVVIIEDLVIDPPAENKYDTLKERLLSRFAESSDSKLRRLLQGAETFGQKPSEILANMKRLAPGKNNEALVKTLFLGQLPSTVRPLLTVWQEEDLDKLAKLADQMLEANSPDVFAVAQVNSAEASIQAVSNPVLDDIQNSIKQLACKVDKIQGELKDTKKRLLNKSRSSSGEQSASNGQHDNKKASTLCFFHTKFGDSARKCHSTCSRWANQSKN